MRARAQVAALAALAALLAAPGAAAATPAGGGDAGGRGGGHDEATGGGTGHGATGGMTSRVGIGFASFAPARVPVLVGDTVTWANESARPHTVTADDRSFDSGTMPSGTTYARRFTAPGTVAYHCRLHPSMTGEVAAATVLLATPAAPAAPDRPYPVTGRAALPAGTEVSVVDEAGATLATASVRGDGSFAATVVPRTTTSLRAVAGPEASAPVRLLVLDRAVTATARRRHGASVISARVRPAAPGETVVLQLRLPLRFGWWPVERRRLDRSSSVRFHTHVRRRVAARVVLALPDGATVLAASSPFHVGVVRRR